jgi:hypothetical protein
VTPALARRSATLVARARRPLIDDRDVVLAAQARTQPSGC